MRQFTWPVRVYYEDTDAGGVVYYANYLHFMERARTEWLRALGFEQDALRQHGILFAVKHVDIDYRRPALFNQSLEVLSTITNMSRVSMTFEQRVMYKLSCLTEANVKVVCLDEATFKPRAIPETMREGLQGVC
ncbi:MAG: tol-pal system-associated acyl-CoA thioesterase [Thiothrix sp.]|nr:MAG: tol-pal system-associated acyl-CoA thioesterase [Thiothrix sp.]